MMKREMRNVGVAAALILTVCLGGCKTGTGGQESVWMPPGEESSEGQESEQGETSQGRERGREQENERGWKSPQSGEESEWSDPEGEPDLSGETWEETDRKSGFETPEKAVLEYLSGFRDGDAGRMTGAFIEKSESRAIANQYKILCGIDLLWEEEYEDWLSKDSQEARQFLEEAARRMEEADVSGLEFVGFVTPEDLMDPDDDSAERYHSYLEAFAENNAGVEMASRAAVVRVNGSEFLMFFDLVREENGWYLYKLGGVLGNLTMSDTGMTGILRLDEEGRRAVEQLTEPAGEGLPETAGRVRRRTRGRGFDTPQQAAAGYLESLKVHDMEQILSTFYLERSLEKYDFESYMESGLPWIFNWQEIDLPPVNDFARELLRHDKRKELETAVVRQGMVLYLLNQYVRDPEAAGEAAAFDWEALPELMDLDSLETLGLVPREAFAELGSVGELQEVFELERARTYYQADDMDSCGILFQCEGRKYILFVETLEYGGKWYNCGFGNRISRIMDIPEDFMGTIPLEMLEGGERAEEMLLPVDFDRQD